MAISPQGEPVGEFNENAYQKRPATEIQTPSLRRRLRDGKAMVRDELKHIPRDVDVLHRCAHTLNRKQNEDLHATLSLQKTESCTPQNRDEHGKGQRERLF